MKINSYRELEAYKKSYQLVLAIYKLTKSYPKEELYGLVSQLRRAAVSTPANMAEGYRRGSKEYVHFLRIAYGSNAEVETLLEISCDLGYMTKNESEEAKDLSNEVGRLLNHYIGKMEARMD